MPKRKHSDKIDRYQRKIRKLEKKEQVIESDSSDSERNSDNEQAPDIGETILVEEIPPVLNVAETEPELVVPELNPEVLAALGDAVEEAPKFGPRIHDNLALLWLPILKKGMEKEVKDRLLKQYPVPENCPLFQAPKLNPEILAAVSDTTRYRDKRVESVQQQLGAGITALNKGLELLLESDKDRLLAVKHLSDSCRLLCDLHFIETEARKKFVTPGLDKSFLNIIQEVERDEMLFGGKLSDKIKASRAIEKQSIQIKKTITNSKPSTSNAQPSTSYYRPQGNWRGSPRYAPSKRGGRGPRKTAPPVSRPAPAPPTKTSSASHHRHRAVNQRP